MKHSSGLMALLFALLPLVAHAEIDPKAEYEKKIKAAQVVDVLGPNLAGDSTSLYTGTTSFQATDVGLPGAGPAVAVGRNYRVEVGRQEAQTGTTVITRMRLFGDWDLDVPSLGGVYSNQLGWEINSTTPASRCSVLSQTHSTGSGPALGAPRSYPVSFPQWWPTEFWSGIELNLPGQGSQSLLVANLPNVPKPTSGGPYHWTAKDSWWFSCLPQTSNNAGGEAFVALSPNGDKYTFAHLTSRWVTQLHEVICTLDGVENPYPPFDGQCDHRRMTRKEYLLLPTRVEDRFGNYVDYTWSNDSFARLISITAKDGRQLSLTYNAAGFVATISDGTRTWNYEYSGSSLTGVVLPDGSRWQYSFASMIPGATPMGCQDIGEPVNCYAPTVNSGVVSGYVVHPSGARVDLTFTNHFKPTVNGMGSGGGAYPVALVSKTVSGPGTANATWTFSFKPTRDEFKASCVSPSGCLQSVTTDAVAPDGSIARSTFGIVPGVNQGMLLSEQFGAVVGGVPVFSKSNTIGYALASESNGFVVPQGTHPMYQDVGLGDEAELFYSERKLPVKLRQTSLQGAQFTWQVNAFDSYANPTTITRASSNNAGGDSTRVEQTAYQYDTNKWVLGLVTTVTCTTTPECTPAKEMSRVDYDPASLLPWKTYRFGVLRATMTYAADGNLATIKDGLNNTTQLGTWKRGIPQVITFPGANAHTQKAQVNNIGALDWVENELTVRTNYNYDAMGRLSKIIYPTADTVAWNDLNRSFVSVASAEYGIPAGHWKQTVQTGNGKSTTYYDARWQAVLTLSEDTGDTATRSFVVARYDALGRQTFKSYPVASLASVNDTLKGIRTTYDPLGRVVQVQQDSETVGAQNVLNTTTEYLTGFQTRVTNPRGLQTVTNYQVFDSPSTDAPLGISLPEGAWTTITRDIFGKPKWISRSGIYAGNVIGVTRYYVYDANERLCKTINPENGAALVDYDLAGNVVWSADGTGLTWSMTCDRQYVAEAKKTFRAYDVMNRVTAVTTPGNTANVTTTYFPDGAVNTVTAANPGGNSVTTTYAYNRRRLLTGESASNGATLFSLGYGYNANAHLSTLAYPDGQVVGYSPDALGRTTQVAVAGGQVYASAIHYTPTGAISDFRYGNNILHTMTPNDRQLPARSVDALNGTTYLDDSYVYDANGNVASITDALPVSATSHSRTLGYDNLDRLITANSPNAVWGNASYSYDAIDNLRSVDMTGGTVTRAHRYNYDANNRLTDIKSPGGTTLFGFGYDVRGNTTSKTTGVTTQARVFDSANRMNQVTGMQIYRYDGLGRRVQTTDADTKTTFWMYSQAGQVIYSSEARRSQNISYVYLGNTQVATRSVAWGTGATTVRYQHTDALGSPVLETSAPHPSTGVITVLKRNVFSPWGETWGSTVVDGTGYTGHVMDQGTGLTYMQQRYYDPGIGRFLSVDPVPTNPNNGANISSYWYANNNPYRFTDPDGRMSSEEAKFKREKAQERRSAYEQRQRVRNSDMIFTRTPPVSESAQQSARQGAAVRVTEQVAKDEGFAAEYAQVRSGGEVTYDPKLAQSEAPFGTDDITFGRSAFAEGLDTLKSVAYHELWHEKQKMHGATEVSRMEWDANAAQLLYIQKSGLSVSESYIKYLEANSRSDPTLTGGQK